MIKVDIGAVCDRLSNSRSLSLFGTTLLLTLLIFLSIGIAWAEQDVTETSPASEQISNSSQYAYSTPPLHLWTCFDYSMNYSFNNPSWGMVCISSNPRFQGKNHVVNYQINYSDNTLVIYDGLLENNYIIEGWEYDSCTHNYYHFYIDSEKPTRHYNKGNLKIRPNAEEVYQDWIAIRQ